MKLITALIQSEKLPYVKKEIDGIEGTLHRIAVLKLKTVLLKGKNLQFFVMEITEKLFAAADEIATMQMIPYRSTDMGIFHVAEMIFNDCFQVFVDTEKGHGIQLR